MRDRPHRPWLAGVHPVPKLAASFLSLALLTAVFDPITPLLAVAASSLAAWTLGGVPPRRLVRYLVPAVLVGWGFFWTALMFPGGHRLTLLGRIGPVALTSQGLSLGLSLGARALALATVSLLFALTTDATDLALSLVQQAGLSPRFAYASLAAYRFLPTFGREATLVRAAHRLRGVGADGGLRGRLQGWQRYALPLLATMVRKADRVALAMESRGFTGDRRRTYARTLRWTWRDAAYVGATALVWAVILWVGAHLGYLRLWNGAAFRI